MPFGLGLKAKNIPSFPGNITSCVLHLRSDAGISFSSITGAVSSWADQSGLGHTFTQATVSKQPIYFSGGSLGPNGQPYLAFNGAVNSSLAAATFVTAATTNWTQFIVVQNLNSTGQQVIFSTGTTAGWGFAVDSGSRAVIDIATPTAVDYNARTANWEAWYNFDAAGTNDIMTINNGAQIVSGTSIAPTAASSASIISNTGFTSWTGNLAEVLIYTRNLAVGEVASVQSYFKSKYGI